jgi:G-patch domain
MVVDNGLSTYGDYVRGAAREVITVATKIKPTNKGFTMLSKLGWSEGQPLGVSGDGPSQCLLGIRRVLTDGQDALIQFPFKSNEI